MTEAKKTAPFDAKFVIRETFRHMQRTIDTSTNKTLARLPEFEGDATKAREVLLALTILRHLHTHVQQLRDLNKELLDA